MKMFEKSSFLSLNGGCSQRFIWILSKIMILVFERTFRNLVKKG